MYLGVCVRVWSCTWVCVCVCVCVCVIMYFSICASNPFVLLPNSIFPFVPSAWWNHSSSAMKRILMMLCTICLAQQWRRTRKWVPLSLSLSIYLSISLSIYLSVYLSDCLSVYFVCTFSLSLLLCFSLSLSLSLSSFLSFSLSLFFLCVCVFPFLSVSKSFVLKNRKST